MLKTFHLMMTGLSIGLTACASQVVPVGDWGRPADLGLHAGSLKGVTVAVRCAEYDRDGQVRDRAFPVCPALEHQLESVGAKIAKENPQYTLWYIDAGMEEPVPSGLSQLAFWFSGFLVPLISTRTMNAEMRVTDGRGVLLDQAPLALQEIYVFGWGALLAMNQKSVQQQQEEISGKFFRFAQNRVASQAFGRMK